MSTIFADSLNQHPIYADRAEKDQLGRNIVCTYATKDEVVGDVLPDMTDNAGKVLTVNQTETAAEWTSVPSPAGKADKVAGAVAGDLAALDCEGNLVDSGIDSSDVATYPSFTNNAGKVLAVNAGETGVEWVNQSGGGSSLPSYTSSDHGKCLKVNSAGTGVEWDTDENTTYTFGSGLTKVGGTVSVSYPVPVPSQPASDVGKVLGITDAYGTLGWVTANSLPSISGKAGKVLKVNDAGTAIGWATDNDTTYTAGNMISTAGNQIGVSTTAGITDIQIVNALPASPVSTVLYLIPLT